MEAQRTHVANKSYFEALPIKGLRLWWKREAGYRPPAGLLTSQTNSQMHVRVLVADAAK
jgi:hypothetical protein